METTYKVTLSDRISGWYKIQDETGNIIADCICSDSEAHLIAAAPELLAALKQAYKCVAYCRKAHPDVQKGEGIPVEALWKDLIAKVEG